MTIPLAPPPVRAISLHQPWATLFAVGEKAFETRSWATRWRGTLLVHASRAKPNADAMRNPTIRQALSRHGYLEASHLPLGCILARAELAGCAVIEEATGAALRGATEARIVRLPSGPHFVSSTEKAFGDFRPGRYGWYFTAFQALDVPIDAVGRQGLWIPTPDIVALALADAGHEPTRNSPGARAAAGATR